MADQTANFAIRLEDDVSGAADSAAKALQKLDQQIAADTKQLAAMQKAMKNLQGGSSVNIEQFRKLKTAIDAKKNTIAQAQASYISLGGAFKSTASSGKALESRLAAIVGRAGEMPGPIGGTVSALTKLKSLLVPPTIALGIAAISAALLAIVVASAAAARSLYNYGVAQADARRSERLRLEGLTKMRFFYARAPGDAKQMQDALDRVAAKVPASREALSKYNDQLYKMGVRGPQLEKALEGVGIKLSTQGEAAAGAFAGFAGGAAITGRSVDKLVDKVKNRLGGIAQRQMSSLTVQALKQKEAMDSLFSGLDMESYLSAWKEVGDLLGQATASGRALKGLTTQLLQPLVGASASTAPIVKRFFQGLIIAALQTTIAILRVRKWWRETFGSSEAKKSVDDTRNWVVILGKGAFVVLIASLGAASVAVVGLSIKLTAWLVPALVKATIAVFRFGLTGIGGAIKGLASLALGFFRLGLSALMAAPKLWAATAPLLPFIAAALGVGAAIFMLIRLWDQLSNSFKQIEWAQMGKDILQGIINGLTNPSALFDSLKRLATDGIHVFKEALGISSPSKEFMKLGVAIPEGIAAGVEKGKPEADKATADLTTPQLAGSKLNAPSAAGGALGGSPAARGSKSISIGELHVHSSGESAKEIVRDIRGELETMLEGLLVELGGPVPT